MGDSSKESPEELRELARRVRFIAAAYDGREKTRLLSYAKELESTAAHLEHEAPGPGGTI